MTNEEISELSPFELNHAIYREHSRLTGFLSKTLPDYCNNWNDLMPLVDKHDITYRKLSDGVHALQERISLESEAVNDNLQRALAECLLKVLIAKEQQ